MASYRDKDDEDAVWVENRMSAAGLSRDELVMAGCGLMRRNVLDLLEHFLDEGVEVIGVRHLHEILINADMELDTPNAAE